MQEFTTGQLLTVVGVALVAHLVTVLIRAGSRRILRSRTRSEAKLLTLTSFATSVIVFGIYFGTVGFLLSRLGISLTTYLASASVIGLAVSFGSQGVVQDVINALTLVFSDLLDVGDVVELGGQVGVVESVGMRFTVVSNLLGARVYVPNRSISHLIHYPEGCVRATLDARLPTDAAMRDQAERRLAHVARAAHEQHADILLEPPVVRSRVETGAGHSYVRIEFRFWPGQAGALEQGLKASVVHSLRELDASYADWMVSFRSGPRAPSAAPRRSAREKRRRSVLPGPRAGSG